jgi:hypothetical protein
MGFIGYSGLIQLLIIILTIYIINDIRFGSITEHRFNSSSVIPILLKFYNCASYEISFSFTNHKVLSFNCIYFLAFSNGILVKLLNITKQLRSNG